MGIVFNIKRQCKEKILIPSKKKLKRLEQYHCFCQKFKDL